MTWVRVDVRLADDAVSGRHHGVLLASSSEWQGCEAWAGWAGLLDRIGELPTVVRIAPAP